MPISYGIAADMVSRHALKHVGGCATEVYCPSRVIRCDSLREAVLFSFVHSEKGVPTNIHGDARRRRRRCCVLKLVGGDAGVFILHVLLTRSRVLCESELCKCRAIRTREILAVKVLDRLSNHFFRNCPQLQGVSCPNGSTFVVVLHISVLAVALNEPEFSQGCTRWAVDDVSIQKLELVTPGHVARSLVLSHFPVMWCVVAGGYKLQIVAPTALIAHPPARHDGTFTGAGMVLTIKELNGHAPHVLAMGSILMLAIEEATAFFCWSFGMLMTRLCWLIGLRTMFSTARVLVAHVFARAARSGDLKA